MKVPAACWINTSKTSATIRRNEPMKRSTLGRDFFLRNASPARVREAENARRNRAEIVRAYSRGQISRRDLIKWGLITATGALAPIHGLNPFIKSAYADDSGI